jgi:predicted Zn-dependent protease
VRFARVAYAVPALIVCAWFALGIRQAHDVGRATAIVSAQASASATQAHEVNSLLTNARSLNPDQEVQVLRGRIALERGDPKRAIQLLTGVTQAEPSNLDGWVWLARASGGDRSLFARALARVRELEPVVPQAP